MSDPATPSAPDKTRRAVTDLDRLGVYADPALLLVTVSLLVLGLVMATSASIEVAAQESHDPLFYFKRQFVFALLGVGVAAAVYRVPLKWWRANATVLLLGIAVLLILVLLPGIGVTRNGSSRWLNLIWLQFQVSELAKLGLIVFIAHHLAQYHRLAYPPIAALGMPLLALALLVFLLLQEPDFGAAAILTVTTLGILFLAGVRVWQLALILAPGAAVLAFVAISSPYRLARLTAFLNPWDDPYASGFQLVQALIAVGSGSWFGVGLGDGVQKLFYLPEAHTDFLFAVLAEELGLVGVAVVLALFAAFIYRGLLIVQQAEKAEHRFAALLSAGITVWIGLQAIINIGVNLGMLPTKGITLPFMSVGGSSLLVSCVAVSLLCRSYRETAYVRPQSRALRTGRHAARQRRASRPVGPGP